MSQNLLSSAPKGYPKILKELADCLTRRLHYWEIAPECCDGMALDLVEAIRAEFKGSLLYIPKGREMTTAQRNAAICRDYDGSNQMALARRYQLSVATIYDILRKHEKGAIAGLPHHVAVGK